MDALMDRRGTRQRRRGRTTGRCPSTTPSLHPHPRKVHVPAFKQRFLSPFFPFIPNLNRVSVTGGRFSLPIMVLVSCSIACSFKTNSDAVCLLHFLSGLLIHTEHLKSQNIRFLLRSMDGTDVVRLCSIASLGVCAPSIPLPTTLLIA